MPAGINIAGDISGYVQTIFEMSNMVARDNTFVLPLVTTFDDNMGTAARTRSEYGTATFNQVSDADDLTSQTFLPTTQESLTPYEFGAQFFITDTRRRNAAVEAATDAANELGSSMATTVQQNVLSKMSSFTGGTVGTAGGTVTWGNIFAAISKLKIQNAPEPYIGVLHVGQWYHLGTVAVPAGAQTNGPQLQDAINARYFVGQFFNTLWFVTTDIASGTAATGGVFSRAALAYDERVPFRIEPERDASRRGIELNATMTYASGVWRPKFGVQIIATSVVP